MKTLFYYTVIMLIAISVVSCSKKKNDTEQQPQNGQELSSEPQENEPNEQESSTPAEENEPNEMEQSLGVQVNEPDGTEQLSTEEEKNQSAKVEIVPVPNQDVIVLNAEETIQILRAAGFSDNQILEYGPAIREGLAKSGAVRILIDKVVEAGLATKGDDIYISTRSRGYFIYNINTGWVNMQTR